MEGDQGFVSTEGDQGSRFAFTQYTFPELEEIERGIKGLVSGRQQGIKRMQFEAAEEERQRLRRWRDERRTLALNATRRRGSYRSDAHLGGSGLGVGDTRRQWISLAAAVLCLVCMVRGKAFGAASGTDEQAQHHYHRNFHYHTMLNRVSNGRALVQNTRGVGGDRGSGSTVSFPSSPFNEIISAGASSDFIVGGGDALGARGHGGSQDVFFDGTGGRFVVIQINTPQQADQGSVQTTPRAEDGPAQRALQSVFGGIVPLCFTLLLSNDNISKGGTYAGLVLVTGFTYVGLVSKKMSKATVRVVASMSMAAVSIALVYVVSEDVYIKCICGIIGGVATLAPIAIHW